MDGTGLVRTNRALFVHRVAQNIHDATQGGFAHRNSNRRTSILHGQAAFQTICTTHRNGTDNAVAKLLLYFQRQIGINQFECIVNTRNGGTRKLHIDYRTNNLYDFALVHLSILNIQICLPCHLHCGGTGYNFRQLGSNRCLTGFVVNQA